jgi:hypothetical protein
LQPAAFAPAIKGGLVQFAIFCSLMKGFDLMHVRHNVDHSFLESNCAIIIDLCDRAWTITFWFLLRVFASFD